ncbi:hypothetical protein BVC80_91g8 [Macleaya cordata]|uniref:Uncharacterized protein n=1 Tax=Macleaya cordata TaxID=56857 RepID=A0A200Q6N3_MACCD|nr:hypothetical protein BVC80_91g8 [Macleaya cordata]
MNYSPTSSGSLNFHGKASYIRNSRGYSLRKDRSLVNKKDDESGRKNKNFDTRGKSRKGFMFGPDFIIIQYY